MIKDSIKVNHRMLKYLMVPEDSQIKEKISLLLEESLVIIDIKKWYKCVSVDKFYESFHPYARESKSISKLLTGAKDVWLVVVTLGEGIGKRVKEYFGNKEVFKGYILDRLGSFLVEEEVKRIDGKISLECKKNGLMTTHRYSPGYGDFSIKAQRIFFDLVRDSIPELKISDGYLFYPEKTVTAVKGVLEPSKLS